MVKKHEEATIHPGVVPVLAVQKTIIKAPAPQPPALALRDQAQPQVRPVSDSVLCPNIAPAVDASSGIVFILDISGSMYEPYGATTRLAQARQFIGDQIRGLKDGTPFALVVYGETARRSGPLIPANAATRAAAQAYLAHEYDCGGGTNLPVGLALARELQMGAIVVVTDGDLNMNASELLPKARRILGRRGSCPAFAVVAIGPRPHTDAGLLLHELVRQQGGTYRSDVADGLAATPAPKQQPNLALIPD